MLRMEQLRELLETKSNKLENLRDAMERNKQRMDIAQGSNKNEQDQSEEMQ